MPLCSYPVCGNPATVEVQLFGERFGGLPFSTTLTCNSCESIAVRAGRGAALIFTRILPNEGGHATWR